MGGLSAFPPWIPEDDLLLKNAVEAGASLESLAKGAVRFSRHYTIRELHDRWHALLYDPYVSAEASTQIVEIEHSISNQSKSNRSLNSRRKEQTPAKRKNGTIHNHYFSLRKRISSRPCQPVDINFFVPMDSHGCTGNGVACENQLKHQTDQTIGDHILETSLPNQYGLPDPGFNVLHHDFPPIVRVGACESDGDTMIDEFHDGRMNVPDGIMGRECLYSFPLVSVQQNAGNIVKHSVENGNVVTDNPQILNENFTTFQSGTMIPKTGQHPTVPVNNRYGINISEDKQLSTLGSIHNNLRGGSDLQRHQNFSSAVSDRSTSLIQMGYSPSTPNFPLWRTIETEIESNHVANTNLSIPDDHKIDIPGYNVLADPKLREGVSSEALNNTTGISEGELLDLSNSLLNFDEENLYINVDDKDMMPRSCLDGMNSMLLNSPIDASKDDLPSNYPTTSVLETVAILQVPENTYNEQPSLDCASYPHHDNKIENANSRPDLCSTSPNANSGSNICHTTPQITHSVGILNEFTICVLNTEDTEIPYNDDILPTVSTSFGSSIKHQNYGETPNSFPSTKTFSDNRKGGARGVKWSKELHKQTLQKPNTKRASKNSINGHSIKTEVPESDSFIAPTVGISSEVNPCRMESTLVSSCLPVKEELRSLESNNFGDTNNSLHGDSHDTLYQTKFHSQNFSIGCKRDSCPSNPQQIHMISHENLENEELGISEPAPNFLPSDREDEFSLSDDDIPYFSDVEALILDMDLIPQEQESEFSREVSRYQYQETKKTIIRLEQSTNSCTQRALSSHGAFAVFYGRHLKHYIKKIEVSIGRATEDITVDIDLSREGRANKISRRQAIIKMEKDGSFYLSNIGKSSILINSKELETGQCSVLSSNCLIEIRGMRFIFTVNEHLTKHLIVDKKRSQQITKFDWRVNQSP